MATKINLEYCGMPGSGATVKEAKQDAARRIESALGGDYTPSLIHWRQYTVLMAREPKYGWGYRISHPETNGIQERMYLSFQGEDRDECLLSLVKHLADIGRPIGEDPEASLPLFNILRNSVSSRAYRDFRHNCKRNDQFQMRYRHAVDVLGMKEGDAHNWAGMNPSTYDTWKGTETMFESPTWEATHAA